MPRVRPVTLAWPGATYPAIFALILTVLWILVPFAVFGIKSLLRQLIAEQRRTNDLLTTPPVAPAATTVRTDVPGEPVYVRRAVP